MAARTMSLMQRRNAMVGWLVIAVLRRSLRRRFGGSSPVWPFFLIGLVGVFGLVVWRRRRCLPEPRMISGR